jgi:CHAT domain-containing protein/Tfp pilus assembly protein PilF
MRKFAQIVALLFVSGASLIAQPDTGADSTWISIAEHLWGKEDHKGIEELALNVHLEAVKEDKSAFDTVQEQAIGLVKDLYSVGAYQLGRSILMDSDSVYQVNYPGRITEIQLEVIYQIALGCYFLYDANTSIKYLERSIPELEPTSFDFAKAQSLLGFNFIDLGKKYEAIEPLELAYPGYVEFYGQNSDKVASNRNDLGIAYKDIGLLNKAEDLFQEGLLVRESIDGGNSPKLFPLLVNLADLYRKKNNHSESQKFFQRAVDLVEGQEEIDSAALNVLYLNLGILLFEKGDLQESRAILDLALDGFQREDTPQAIERQGMVYLQRAKREAYVENYEESISILENAQSLLASLDQQKFRETCNQVASNLGVYHNRAGNYDAALTYLYSLRDSLVEDPDGQDLLANVYNEIAESYRGLGNESEAERFARLALAKQIELYGYPDFHQAFTYNQLAKLAAERGTPNTRVLALVDSALLMNGAEDLPLEGYIDYEFYLESLLLKAKHSTGDRAMAMYSRANEVLAALRTRLISAEDKLNFAKFSYQIASEAIARSVELMQQGESVKRAAIFDYFERGKANVLSEMLALNQGKAYAGIPADSLAMEEDLQAEMAYFQLALANAPDSLSESLYRQELFGIQRAYRALVDTFLARYPAYYQLKYQPTISSLDEVQSSLREGELLVSYFIGEEALYVYVISTETAEVYQQPISAELERQVTGLRRVIDLRLDEDYFDLASTLFQTLFPFEIPEGTGSLIMVPDGTLSQVPFSALLTEPVEEDAPSLSALPYLINSYSVQYAPSASLLMKGREKAARQYDQELLAYAPIFAEPQELADYGTVGRSFEEMENIEVVRSVSVDGKTVAPLPGALQEVENIAEVFEENGKTGQTFLFDKASESQIKESLASKPHRFLHVATHGFVNHGDPNRSGLLFYPDSTSQEDHVLYSAELYGLQLNTDMVVLSACETGLGNIVRGEGLLGLSRAFLYAGAENLMVSLWKVQDRATADLMVDFYRLYYANPEQGYSAALREAKLDMIATERYAHPYYWSPFVLLGK